jgi:membrane associated rhomboid family serine protease
MTDTPMRTSTDVAAARRPAPAHDRPSLLAGVLDALVVTVWFAVAGLVGALVWWQVTTLPKVTKVGEAASMEQADLLRQVGIDGWFFVIAAVGGLLSGVLLLIWRERDPLLMVVLVVLGGALASWVTVHVGLALGPPEEMAALRGMKEGAQVPMQLKLHAPGMAWTWSVFAALGATLHVWVLRRQDDEGS